MDYPKNLSEKDHYWLNIIQECRASGKSDYQWLQENNIVVSTFYYHVKQLQKKTCEIPNRNVARKKEVQEVVPLIIEENDELPQILSEPEQQDSAIAVRLNVHAISVEISTGATQEIILCQRRTLYYTRKGIMYTIYAGSTYLSGMQKGYIF